MHTVPDWVAHSEKNEDSPDFSEGAKLHRATLRSLGHLGNICRRFLISGIIMYNLIDEMHFLPEGRCYDFRDAEKSPGYGII